MEKFPKNTKRYMIMFCAAAVVTAAFAVAAASPAFASPLPSEVGKWRLDYEQVTDLTAAEKLGKWTSASYVRLEPIARIDVQLTEGTGPGELFVPEGVVSSDDGPIGFSSKYETLSVAGSRAVLEQSDVTGQALAVSIGAGALKGSTVTFESRGVSREELLDFVNNMVEALQN